MEKDGAPTVIEIAPLDVCELPQPARVRMADEEERLGADRSNCSLKHIERDYDGFNRMRTPFTTVVVLDPLPAGTGIRASLCRFELPVEIEDIASAPMERIEHR